MATGRQRRVMRVGRHVGLQATPAHQARERKPHEYGNVSASHDVPSFNNTPTQYADLAHRQSHLQRRRALAPLLSQPPLLLDCRPERLLRDSGHARREGPRLLEAWLACDTARGHNTAMRVRVWIT